MDQNGGAVRGLKRLSSVVLGGLIGYGLWRLYFDSSFLSSQAASLVVTKRNAAFLGALFGNENQVIAALLFMAAVLRTLPASVLLGTVMGFLLPRIRDQRALCYSVLIWPIARYAWHLIYPEARSFFEANWGAYVLQMIAIYVVFYVSLFVSFTLLKRKYRNDHQSWR